MNSFTAVSEINQGPRVVARFGRADRDRAFRAAVRHSRHVRILRVAVPPTTVVVFLSGVAFTVLMKPLRVLSDVDVSLVVSGTKIKMKISQVAIDEASDLALYIASEKIPFAALFRGGKGPRIGETHSPYQVEIYTPGAPASSTVGMLGAAANRLFEVTA